MAVAGLPVGAEPVQSQAQNPRAQIGHGAVGQNQEAAVVDHQAQAAITLGARPTDPLIAVLEMFGGGAEEQQRHPAVLGIDGGGDKDDADLLQQPLLSLGRRMERRFFCFMPPKVKSAGIKVPKNRCRPYSSTLPSLSCKPVGKLQPKLSGGLKNRAGIDFADF